MVLVDELEKLKTHGIDRRYVEVISGFLENLPGDLVHGKKLSLDHGVTVVLLDMDAPVLEAPLLEAHRQYHDLHCTLAGVDVIGGTPIRETFHVKQEYNSEHDYILFTETPESLVEVRPGNYCLISPLWAHMALLNPPRHVRKVVFKIPVNQTV
jgi:YhcH/YjgK/YiaL family protein